MLSGAVLTVEARQIGVRAGWRSGFSLGPDEAAGFLDLAFSAITRYGDSSPRVARRLLTAGQALQRGRGPGRRAAV